MDAPSAHRNFTIGGDLCERCREVVRDVISGDYCKTWKPSLKSRMGALNFVHRSGVYFRVLKRPCCVLCEVIVHSMRHKQHTYPLESGESWHLHIRIENQSRKPLRLDQLSLGCWAGAYEDPKDWQALKEGLLLGVQCTTLASPEINKGILPDLPEHLPFEEVQSWIEACVSRTAGHEDCHRQPHVLPTRVVDVLSNPPRLVESDRAEQTYIALSHCWGGMIRTRLLRETYATFTSNGIHEDTLPATFKDAIFITKRLGFRWLWIDALCIIQDDAEDWATESSQMCSVYERATFVLSADSTSSSEAGLAFRRSAHVASTDTEAIYFTKDLDGMGVDPEMPLSSRGWTLQERALAVAVLSVGRGTIRWLCPGGQYTEQGGGKLTEYHSALNQTLRAATRAPTTAAEAWREIVEDYTRRSLTYPADKLPAIAGLAAKFEAGNPTFGPSVMRHQHMVGLWRHTLLADLMWAIDREVIPTPMSHRAPSWSWAGWEGAISWSWYRAIGNSDGFSELCSIDLHKTCISDTDRAAKAVSGKLFISGLLVLVSLDSIKSSSLPIDSKETFATRSDADDFRVPCVVRDVLQGRMATRARYRREIAGSLDQDVTGPCWALRLASGKTRGSEMATAFMLLEETREICNLELRRTFRRAGMVIVKYDYCDYIEPAQKVKYKSDPGQYPLQDPIGWVGQTEYIIII